MTGCVHKVRWSVKRPEDCRFRLSVSHYKDRIVAPDEYSGATMVTPSDSEQVLATKDKLVRSDITVNPAPEPDLRPLTIDSLTQHGIFLPTGDGFSQVTVEEDWDGVLLPPEDGLNFYTKWVTIEPNQMLIVDAVGAGQRWFCVGARMPELIGYGRNFGAGNNLTDIYYKHMRHYLRASERTTVFLAGYEWQTEENIRREDTYGFRGEYMKWKVLYVSS